MDLNILILSFYYYPDLCAGSFRCTALVKQLEKMTDSNTQIEVITTLPNRYSSFEREALAIEKHGRLTIQRIKLPRHQSGMTDQTRAFIYFAKEVMKRVRSEQYDLVFATSSRLMTLTLGALIARKKQARLYLDIRDIFVDTISDILPKKMSFVCKPVFSMMEKWSIKRANKVNLISKGFESYFTARYPSKSFNWFSNGIDEEFLLMEQTESASVAASKPVTVMYAGNIGEGQGLHHIIPDLAHRMKDLIQFKIFGDGGRTVLLKSRLRELNCENVALYPPVERDSLIREYQQADVLFLHLNHYQAFEKVLPSKIFEYAAFGKPIWAGVSGFSAEFIQSEISNAAVFQPCDAKAGEQAFRTLFFESKMRHDFIKKYARESIMKDMVEDILELVQD